MLTSNHIGASLWCRYNIRGEVSALFIDYNMDMSPLLLSLSSTRWWVQSLNSLMIYPMKKSFKAKAGQTTKKRYMQGLCTWQGSTWISIPNFSRSFNPIRGGGMLQSLYHFLYFYFVSRCSPCLVLFFEKTGLTMVLILANVYQYFRENLFRVLTILNSLMYHWQSIYIVGTTNI